MRKKLKLFIAWSAGWLIYMLGLVNPVADINLMSLIFQSIIACFVSALFVALALLIGLLNKINFIGKIWYQTNLWAYILIGGSLCILCFGEHLGITGTFTDPKTGDKFTDLHILASVLGYFFVIYGIANWPLKIKERSAEPGA